MSIGHSPSQSQWTPDMRKDASDITEEDKREAHRRIRGGDETVDSSS
jgi:phosphatidylserine decarboxylase